ncbi:hypothetical protein ACG5V6_08810 [Streptomyces chitinivorans]|uniref:Uncharacterized protein n=1 Tax=Streptomyces chitinivorans TaxID=1257027 RepID=A0ABW7HR29_9ACTN|nr:hypothetical protein [Streptomyces chitinivorans]MDH2409837.1 hypothetical protein [Streptomyces chitinivorans]
MTETCWIRGSCWLWCRRDGVLVMWLGDARTEAESAPVYACGPCVEHLAAKVKRHATARYGFTETSYRQKNPTPY